MKERYNVEIADINLTIISDESEEFVNSTVEKINERVNDMIARNKRCSKLDAALLCALDYCGEYQKAERRIRNLEAQISLYDANLKRLREDLAAKGGAPESAKTALGVTPAAGAGETVREKKDETPKAHHAAREQKSAEDNETVNMLDAGPAADTETRAAAEDEKRASTRSKLEQIEMLLRKSNADE
jgi:cell division protein ZapA (FtsZ GTPase activity inhibitor)